MDSVLNVVVELIVDVATSSLVAIVDEDRPVVPFAADEVAMHSLTVTAGSSAEASRVFAALRRPLLEPCWAETSGQGRC